tara:strand:- start:7604 stop:7846 length:243 start_codon:yes stop_codon:yes gene_type:complete
MYPQVTQMSIKTSAPIPHLSFNSYDELTELYQAVEHIPEELKEDIPIYGALNTEQKALTNIILRLKSIHDEYIKKNYFEQ